MRTLLIAIMLFCFPVSVDAQLHAPFRAHVAKVKANVMSHKWLYAADFGAFAIMTGDAFTTMYAERRCKSCVDMGFFGPHPSGPEVFTGAYGYATLVIFMNHYSYKHAPDVVGQRFFTALFSIPIFVGGAADIRDNLNAAKFGTGNHAARLAADRARISRLNTSK
ncbi:MAG TPA: hypothetical protein VND65_14975 [Candidatus Binatia bacterium]|nr:hypothetical protein [Candidatus Binatia bacterium]